MKLGRTCPTLPCTACFADDEWRPVWQIVKRHASARVGFGLVFRRQRFEAKNRDGIGLHCVRIASQQRGLVAAVKHRYCIPNSAIGQRLALIPLDPNGNGFEILHFVGRKD